MGNAGDELVDIIDQDGRVIDVLPRRVMRGRRLLHRCIRDYPRQLPETLVNSRGIRCVMPHAILGLLLDLAIDVSGCVTRNPVDGCRYHFKSLIRA